MIPDDFTRWFKDKVEPKVLSSLDIKYVSNPDTEFGEFGGIQLGSGTLGGHIYFWSSGFYSFHLYDTSEDWELIPVTEGEYNDEPFDRFFEPFLKVLGESLRNG